ncbi:bifunctional glutamate N-acetyltransferase/amino-acid acetyltransferase ArgJ [Rugosimonospora africana]|uniref:bifunctional glutamate N-acetyltransferase/amino-acid acetyltransferase ArgJ n=1 Tax=Rugosimonospora africana TaxID=556532 RepID=UPI0019458A71|nr:bifunctional glutamate N-acetyltransferase/amino-acid acetyltransferase ArgJ [Rugosimonospora africana]
MTAARGFRAAGVAAGIKASGALDLALVVNDGPAAAAAGVFTANRVKAAPVLWSQQVLRGGVVHAVVLNSGGANACTGAPGFQDTHATAEHAARVLSGAPAGVEVGAGEVAVCSTGLIGERLPMDSLLRGVETAAGELSGNGGGPAARAIMTTDTRPKTTVVAGGGGSDAGGGWCVGGMAKGAGMLAPGLATMLVVLTTDAVADAATLDTALREATRVSFDRVDSDGCMSTNDTVLLLASGASGIAPEQAELTAAVTAACHDLAAALLADAEGSTKDIAIEVTGAASEADALEVGRTVARNNLVKTALFGNDPNWGRIIAAVGTTDAAFEADRVDVAVNGVWVCRGGCAAEDRSTVDLTGRAVTITVDLHAGGHEATIWTNDLSLAYVHENSAYSS